MRHVATWDEVIALCEAELLEVERSTSYGTPALKVKGKLFARLKEDEERIAIFVDFMEREAMTQENPDAYIVTDHYRDWPMMLVDLEAVPDDELREVLIESWRRRAPKKLVAELRRRLAAEEAAEPGVLGRRAQLRRGGGVDVELHGPLVRALDLGRIDELRLPLGVLEDEAVQDVLPLVVGDADHLADLDPVGAVDRRPPRNRRVVDGDAVVSLG